MSDKDKSPKSNNRKFRLVVRVTIVEMSEAQLVALRTGKPRVIGPQKEYHRGK